MDKLRLEDDHMCYVCGKDNAQGFKLAFKKPENGRLSAEVTFSKHHQGFKDIVHGGLVATLMDEVMLNLCWLTGVPAVTAELSLRLKKPVPVGEKILFEARVEREESRALFATASAKNKAGELLATAKATCFKVKTQ